MRTHKDGSDTQSAPQHSIVTTQRRRCGRGTSGSGARWCSGLCPAWRNTSRCPRKPESASNLGFLPSSMSGHCPLQKDLRGRPLPRHMFPSKVSRSALPGQRGRDSQHFSATGPAALPSHSASHFMAHLPEFHNRHRPSAGCAHSFCIFRWKVPEWAVGRSPSPPSSRTPRRL